MNLCYGCTRTVLITKNYAFKFPSLSEYRLFLHGLLGNLQEARLSALKMPELCPVVFKIPLGFLVVMRRAAILTREEFLDFDPEKFKMLPEGYIPVESKADSFGWLDGRIVAVDYGSRRGGVN